MQAVRAESKDITFDQDARKRMQIGINKLADAVGVTLGPRGSAAVTVPGIDTSFADSAHCSRKAWSFTMHCVLAGRNVVLEQAYGVPQVTSSATPASHLLCYGLDCRVCLSVTPYAACSQLQHTSNSDGPIN